MAIKTPVIYENGQYKTLAAGDTIATSGDPQFVFTAVDIIVSMAEHGHVEPIISNEPSWGGLV